jgi:hypothetical protein
VVPDVSTNRSAFVLSDREVLRLFETSTQRHTTRCATVGTSCTSALLILYTQDAPVMKRPRIPAPKSRPEHETDSSHIRELLASCVTSCTSIVCAENIGTSKVTIYTSIVCVENIGISDLSCNLLSAKKTSARLTSRPIHLLSV